MRSVLEASRPLLPADVPAGPVGRAPRWQCASPPSLTLAIVAPGRVERPTLSRRSARRGRDRWASIVVIWLMAPRFLYPRFFLWLIPVVAVGVARRGREAAGADRARRRASSRCRCTRRGPGSRPIRTRTGRPRRSSTRCSRAAGFRARSTPYTGQRMVGYTTRYGIPRSENQASQCAVAFRIGRPGPLDHTFDRLFPYRVKMNAETSGVLWSPVPLTCWTADPPTSGCDVPNR